MSWVFNGSAGIDQVLVLAPGAITTDGGPLTFAAIVKTNAGPERSAIGGGFIGGSEKWGILFEPDSKWYVNGDFSGFSAAAAVGFWQLIGYTKASGSAAVRWHMYDYNAATWTHANGSTIGDAGTADEIRIGRFFNRADGKLAVAGAANTALSDGQFEAGLHTGILTWLASTDAVWKCTGPVASGLTDLTGGGANQTSTIGNAPVFDSDEPPGFSYSTGSTITGTAAAPLGALTAAATGLRTRFATATATLGALGAAANGSVPSTGGGWYGLLDILAEARAEARAYAAMPPVACPNDGEPLRTGPRGELRCPWDGFVWGQ